QACNIAYLPEMFSETDLETMKWVRKTFDPQGIANPEKLFPSPRTCGEAARAQAHKQFPTIERF
ncbi:MAG: FAD-binding oxidoreductase, partial [Merismopedia sp. SIO2A8]|nr:FAD-binding oxidoreductase [Merismopedia sp. SIO2A8]